MRIRRHPLAVGLIVGGALGNITDRLLRGEGWLRGGVVDFIDVQWWPIFNVADIAVTTGGALLLLTSFFGADQPTASPTDGPAGATERPERAERADPPAVDAEPT